MKDSRKSMREEMQKRMDKENQHYQRRGSLFRSDVQGVKFFKCKEGPNLLDILAYTSGKYDPIEADSFAYVLRVFIHRGVSQDGGDIICIEQTFKNQQRREELFGKGCFCPVCKEYRRRVNSGATKEETDGLRYANWPRAIYNVYDRRDPGQGIQIWETSSYLLQQYLDVISKRSALPGETQGIENYIPYMDIEEGRSISFKREGMDEKTKFIGIAFEDRRTPITEKMADEAKPLDEIIAWPTVASAHEAFWGVPMDDANPTPPTTRGAKYEKEQPKKNDDVPAAVGKTPEEIEEEELQAKLDALKKKKAADAAPKETKEKQPDPALKEGKVTEAPKASASGTNQCPSSYRFGVDIDDKPECEKCGVWKDCAKENDRLDRLNK